MEQEFLELGESEIRWRDELLRSAPGLIGAFSPEDNGIPISLDTLDRAWGKWLGTHQSIEEVNTFINVFGIFFGQALVDTTQLKWVIAKDRHGTELALFGYKGKGDILLYPTNFVSKRWETGTAVFFKESFGKILETIKEYSENDFPN
jgi:hypothetical protein